MTPELSIYWQSLDQLDWRWHDEAASRSGRWDDLVDQVRRHNRTGIAVRLYLPHHWFTSLSVRVPAGNKRVAPAVLRFTAEEQLAQDIDSLHIVPLGRPVNSQQTVLVIEKARLENLQSTLADGGLSLTEAYDAAYFHWPEVPASDIQLDLHGDTVFCRHGWLLHQVHRQGFAQWFETFKQSQGFNEAVQLSLSSRDNDEQARQLRAELEAAGDPLEWIVCPLPDLADWDERCRDWRGQGNLMSGALAVRSQSGRSRLWLPSAAAVALALCVWLGTTALGAWHDQQRAAATWAASETVFRQVFGPDKRIQRPLMEREIDNRIRNLAGGTNDQANTVLNAIEALTVLDDALVVDDFRYQHSSGEMLFTLRQPAATEGDAFARFEAAKTALQDRGYQVEYSASQDSQAVRGRFQARPESIG